MIRFQPYEQYDVQAIEQWLNGIAAQGWKLTEFGAFLCKFKPDEGVRRYYRVRYIPANKDIGNAFFWGDLYVYHATDLDLLPPADYDEDSVLAAREQGKPSGLIVSALLCWRLGRKTVPEAFMLEAGDYLLYTACILSVIFWVLHFVFYAIPWLRANQIAEYKLKPSEKPPKKYAKLIGQISLIPALGIMILFWIANI